MNHDFLSPKIVFYIARGKSVQFRRFLRVGEEKPSIESCKCELNGILLAYSFCDKQDYGIRPLAKAFGALNEEAKIKQVPLEIVSDNGFKAIKYGEDVDLDCNLIRLTRQSGMAGYWDSANIIICATPEYSFMIDSISKFIKPDHTAFALEGIFGNRGNLVIMSVD